jgi:hypothetical protein
MLPLVLQPQAACLKALHHVLQTDLEAFSYLLVTLGMRRRVNHLGHSEPRKRGRFCPNNI